jgi:hypothetical protein
MFNIKHYLFFVFIANCFNAIALDSFVFIRENEGKKSNQVKIENFKSYHYNTSQVYLEWNVIPEHNINSFQIERSLDGINFTTVGEIKNLSNSTKKKLFEYVDEHPKIGENYYRLRQISVNGESEISEVNKIEIVKIIDEFIIHPNPATHNFDISFLAGKQGIVGIKIITEKGNVIKDFFLLSEEGFNNFQVDVSDIAAGSYNVTLSDFQSETLTSKVIKE